jgi:choice-of-anchor A domain-containing protein
MSLPVLWQQLISAVGVGSGAGNAPARKPSVRTRPILEALEDRSAPSVFPVFELTDLEHFGVLGLTGAKIDMSNPQTRVGGDVGIGPNGTLNFADGQIEGRLIVDPTANGSHRGNVHILGGIVTQDLQMTVGEATDLSNQAAALAPTQTFGQIGGSQTINSTVQINVIKVGSVQLNGSATLTLNGGPSDFFVINVTGTFAMTGTSAIKLTGGIQPAHVLFNIVGKGEQVAFTGKSVATGVFLAVNRDIADAGATINGSLIGGMNHQISVVSGSQVIPPPPGSFTGIGRGSGTGSLTGLG